MRATFISLFLGWAIALAVLAGCFGYRVPVQVVQVPSDQPVVVAPVGTVEMVPATATQPAIAIMNPRVMDPAKVGPLPEPQPAPEGGGWLQTILIGAVAILFPAAVPFVRGFLQYRAAFANVIGSVQAVKDALPAQYRDRVNATLASSQSKSTSDLVNKVKVKAKKPTGVQP
jgi:hypothetical protein